MDYRCEKKYLCTKGQQVILRSRLRGVLQPDEHNPTPEGYVVRSVYFDDCDDRMLEQNLDGVDDRIKFRIRLYNGDLNYIRLEIKRKKAGFTKKEHCMLTKEQAESILAGRCPSVDGDSPAPLRHLFAEMNSCLLRPRVIIEYRRSAMVGRLGNVRVTFDTDIRFTKGCSRFFDPVIPMTPLIPAGQAILEVKYDEFIPDWVAQAIELGDLNQMTFSKYAYARTAE